MEYLEKDLQELRKKYPHFSLSALEAILAMADNFYHAEKMLESGKDFETLMAESIGEIRRNMTVPHVAKWTSSGWDNGGLCHHCGGSVYKGYNFCPNCGYRLYYPEEGE